MSARMAGVMVVLALIIAPFVSTDRVAVTPVQQVIKLLTDMKSEIEIEGESEGKTYAEFACFCKSKTESISKGIMKGKDDCTTFAAGFEEKSAEITKKQRTSKAPSMTKWIYSDKKRTMRRFWQREPLIMRPKKQI